MGNLQVVLTRPEGDNESLAERFEAPVLVRPLIKLSALPVTEDVKRIALELDRYDAIIFISKSAVLFGMEILDQYWPQWPVALSWFSVGSGTAGELDKFGVKARFPDRPGSEGLLALEELSEPEGQKVLIVRGKGGRELLAGELKARGAEVEYLEIYEREPIRHEWDQLLDPEITHVVVLTSGEIAEQFTQQADDLLRQCIAIVPSTRVEELASVAPYLKVVNAGGASDQALYDAVLSVLKEFSH